VNALRTPEPDEARRTVERYRMLWEAHGDSYRTLDWGSEASQRQRFAVLADGLSLAGCRLLDVGCGLGHFADWLDQSGIALDYTGLDLTAELVAHAARRHPARTFVTGSVIDPAVLRNARFDVVVASGIFATYPEGGMPWMRSVIDRMWHWTDTALAFNSLSTWAAELDPQEFHADPVEVLRHCGTLSTRVRLRHDYHPRDFSVQLWKHPSGMAP
jgi:SAM-dependent methyltransferase